MQLLVNCAFGYLYTWFDASHLPTVTSKWTINISHQYLCLISALSLSLLPIHSGESGAGKTESTKFMLSYLSTMSQKRLGGGGSKNVESAILESRYVHSGLCVVSCIGPYSCTFMKYLINIVEPVYSGYYLGQRLLPVMERWPDYTCILQ